MRRYLLELHKKPEEHRKRVALFLSGAITLFIFGIWSFVTFGTKDDKLANTSNINKDEEVSPFQSIRMNMAASLEAIGENFDAIKANLEAVDLEKEYIDMRDGALKNYEQ